MQSQQQTATCPCIDCVPPSLGAAGCEAHTGLLILIGMPIDMSISCSQSCQGRRLLLLPTKRISCNAFTMGRHRTKRCAIRASSGETHQPLTRRSLGRGLASLGALLPVVQLLDARIAWGLGFKKELKKRKVSVDQYSSFDDGLKYYDQAVGSGEIAEKGKKVKVHFDCMYKGIDVVSSRQARLLGGNRTISEPIEFVAGGQVAGAAVKKITDTAGGLFAGTGGPKPPPALSSAVLGMRTGGKRSIIVPPELGYGKDGLQEIPPNGTFELEIELLSVG